MAPAAITLGFPRRRLRATALLGCLTVAVSWLCPSITGSAEERYSAASVEAVYLYRFGGYIEWPPQALSGPGFTIAVLGDEEVADVLSRVLKEHSVGRLPASVRRARNLHDLADAQMVYVGEGYRGDLHEVISSLGHRPVLVVTDEADGLEAGSMVNFVIADGRVRFEVSLPSAARAGLKISSQLLAVAVRVQTE